MTAPHETHLRATYAALYALGTTIPPQGMAYDDLRSTLGAHLDKDTFHGLICELQRRKVVAAFPPGRARLVLRGPEYHDALERLRLAGESLKRA